MQRPGSNEPYLTSAVLLTSNCLLGSNIAEAIESFLIPTIQQMQRNTALHVAFVLEGVLLEQLEQHYPEQLAALQALSKSKQAEFFPTPHFRPHAALCDATELKQQLLSNQERLAALALTTSPVAYLSLHLYPYLKSSGLAFNSILLETSDENLLAQNANLIRRSKMPISLHQIATNRELSPSELSNIKHSEKFAGQNCHLAAYHDLAISQLQLSEAIFHQQLMLEHNRISADFAQLRSDTAFLTGKDSVTKRITKAARFLALIKHESIWQLESEKIATLRIAAFAAVISADVEIEAIRYADIDPNEGWARLLEKTPTADYYTIDTQLLRMTFSRKSHGGLISCHYKPRKINLCNVLCQSDYRYSFCTSLIEKPENASQLLHSAPAAPATEINYLKNRRTSGLVGIRLTKSFAQHSDVKLVEDYTVRSGLGAYNNNSTTGWTFEHWLEGKPSDNALVRIDFHFQLATPIPHAISTRALTIASAEAEHAAFLDKPHLLQTNDISGGLHGIRLIDGINNFTIDLRSAKPLVAATVIPQIEGEVLQGIAASFYLPAKNLLEDNHSNTIYVSIP